MGLRFSEGASDSVLAKIKADFDGGFIDVYTGAPPASASQAPTGTKLGTFTLDGDGVTGLTFDAPSGRTLSKPTAAVWRATGIAAGTAGWFRLRQPSDTGVESTTEKRIDGLVARTGADLNMTNTVFAVGSPHTIDTCRIGANANA